MQSRNQVIATYAVILTATAAVWIWAIREFYGHPVLLGSAFLAYTLGLRHAVDADHIAAIDNVTRKLMQEGIHCADAGFFFSLGHSSVVILVSAFVAMTAGTFSGQLGAISSVGSVLGTCVSAVFLLGLGLINIVIFFQIYKTFKQVRETGIYSDEDLDLLLSKRGFLSKIFRRLFGMVRASRQMFPIGFLFGLGFDTSTEVAMIGIAAASLLKGMSIWSIMIFPLLFTAGMTLVDTTDGVLMQKAYQWAYLTPVRKLYYNLAMTAASVIVALIVAGIEALGLLGGRLSMKGCFWDMITALNGNLNTVGFFIIGFFLSAWLLSVLIYRLIRYDGIRTST
ncbi:MAG: HoxN/HupN/NixA family nickel/cobalt transporter [Candidatus Omnitrophica bacterium]|nr:HoxN/HupN/NixA family nickel/cobalt transporter [Candidatus Omnitrophota bacterium]MDE2009635.1 HoxN/HupN/NixA family nickel/cobalt transporter [Candidatus Omnitrophota bacterium]MDE2214437.1 HoxN/HupN/NixA family nickel/cobalt transporter [Candidatus Omnitrophota bacterium]MDE2231577.1 HoxN/HupN/NixA family nickel/cobalt transporter [Candidatus Omnitrophota bacterium]